MKEHTADELLTASKRKLKLSNKPDCAKVLTLATGSPSKPAKILDAFKKKPTPEQSEMSAESAYALIASTKSSVDTYKQFRAAAEDHGHKVYPDYHHVLKAKKLCYPEDEFISHR